jgi:flagellar protein FliO/FliZ
MFSRLLWGPFLLLGDAVGTENEKPGLASPDPWWPEGATPEPMFSKVLLALFVVIVLIFITLYLMRRFFKIGRTPGSKGRMRVVDTLPLGAKRMVQVLEVGDRTLVIGVTPSRIDLLTELSLEDVPDVSMEKKGSDQAFGAILPLRPDEKEGKTAGVQGLDP